MQKYILIITLTFSVSSVLANTKTNITLDWDCKSVNYEGQVQRLPDRERVTAEIKVKSNGDYSIKFKNNIFKDGLKQQVGGFLGGIFGSSTEPTHAVDYSECLEQFRNQFERKVIEEHAQVCRNNTDNCPSSESFSEGFNNKLANQKTVKKINDLPKVPRYFTGHNESYINFDVREKLNDYCIENQEVSLEVMTSQRFIEQVANEVINLNPVVTDDCLERIETQLKENNDFSGCEGNNYPCSVINSARETYSDDNLNFIENKHQLISERAQREYQEKVDAEKEILARSGTIVDPNADIEEKVQQEIDELIEFNADKSSSYCWSDYQIMDGNRRKSIFNYDSIIQQKIPYLKENLKPSCLEDFIENYIAHKYRSSDPLEDELCQNHDCELIRQQKRLFEENLNGMIQYTFGDAAVQYSCNNPLPNNYGDFEQITQLMNNMKQVNQCSPLENGEVKVVDDYATTGVKMRYSLQRNSAQELQANVVINFKDPDEGATTTPEEMMERTQDCIEKASSYFTSANGETIRVNVMTPEQAQSIPNNERPGVNDVGIGESGMRSNSGKYAENVGCGTITHEVLHLMGLCDEYTETQRGYYVNTETGEVSNDAESAKNDENYEFVTAYNQCRAISETPSIMSSHWEAMRLNTGSKTTCSCNEGQDEICRNITRSQNKRMMEFAIRNPFNLMNNYSGMCQWQSIGDGDVVMTAAQINEYNITPTRNLINENRLTIDFNSLELASSGYSLGRMNKYRFTCQCESGDESCQRKLDEIRNFEAEDLYPNSDSCPYPIFKLKEGVTFSDLISKDELIEDQEFKILPNNDIEVFEPPKIPNGSLLHPAHFTRIKYGSCQEKAQTYSMCAKFAYKALAKDCPDRPAVCDKEEQWLLSDQ